MNVQCEECLLGAVSAGERKESAISSFLVRLSKLSSTCLSNARQWWYIRVELPFLIWDLEREIEKNKKQHCLKGYHKLSRRVFSVIGEKKKESVEYLSCYCGYCFFATLKDKQKYLRLSGGKRKNYKDFGRLIEAGWT